MSVADLRSSRLIAGGVYAVTMAAVAIFAAWPIYVDPAFAFLAAASVVVALAVAVAAVVWEWRGWLVGLVLFGAFLVLGLTLAVPPSAPTPAALLGSLRDLALGAVTGWKDLVTVDLPVGSYRNLLVPALIVLLGGTLVTVLLARRRGRGGAWAAVTGLTMTLFGILFGRTVVSAPLVIGGVFLPAPREIACGALALVLSLFWLAWRSQDQRREALRRAADTSGVRVSRRRSASDARRGVLAAAMVVLAVGVAAIAAPAVAAGRTRDVLRTDVGPELAISRAASPLSEYRANFADAGFEKRLFTVTALQGALPDRIRIATLSSYDGAVYRVSDPDSSADDARFVRVPSRLPGGTGREASVRIQVDGLRGIWLPTFGSLQQVDFAGANASDLGDAFYYNRTAEAAVDTASGGLTKGDDYTVTATVAATPDLSTIVSPRTAPTLDIPESVKTWVEQQNAGTDGRALDTLVTRLRDRGYLSHALEVPTAGAAWVRALGAGYTFQPSASGHSLARVDALFRQLLARQAAAKGTNPSLVSGIGDDEQFAVATALIAQQLGFPARVVVGVRLSGDDTGVPPCAAGVCSGANVTAWTEVQSNAGVWVAVDATPQHETAVDDEVTRQRDPENRTDVRPQSAQEVVPPDPVQHDAADTTPRKDAAADLTALWQTVRVVGIVLLALIVILGPFAVIVIAKSLRRRARRGGETASARVVGGWEEYVDASVDHGLPPPGSETRGELAARYDSAAGASLAVVADRVVFADTGLSEGESEEFWRIVDDERHRLAASTSLWRRVVAAVSLRSFTRGLAPRLTRDRARGARGTLPSTERRGRGRDGGVHRS